MKIDVQRVIAAKNEGLAKRLPKFVTNAIARLIHQQELNEFFAETEGIRGVEFAKRALKRLSITYSQEIQDPGIFDSPEKYIFVSNHPLGGLDGLTLISAIGSRYPKIKFLVNDFLMHVEALGDIFVPVNKVGGMTRTYSRAIEEMYASDCQLLYFPAGLCSRLIKGEITDLKWQNSFYRKALESGRKIVPVHFSGGNSKRFYRIAKIRKALGIKFNVEMILLPDEMIRAQGSHFTLKIGAPITPKPYSNRDELEREVLHIRELSYNL